MLVAYRDADEFQSSRRVPPMAAVIAAETIGAATGGPGRLPYALHQALNSSYGVGTNGSIWIKSPLRKRTGGPLAAKCSGAVAVLAKTSMRVVKIIDWPPITIIDGNRVIGWM